MEVVILPEEDRGRYHTLSGMTMLLTGRLPEVADSVTWQDWRFDMVDMGGNTIGEVLATRSAGTEPGTSDDD